MDVRMGHFEAQNDRCYPIAARIGLNFTCNTLGEEYHGRQCLIIKVVEVIYLLLWDDERMALCEWIDVQEGVETLILGYFIARNLSGYDT